MQRLLAAGLSIKALAFALPTTLGSAPARREMQSRTARAVHTRAAEQLLADIMALGEDYAEMQAFARSLANLSGLSETRADLRNRMDDGEFRGSLALVLFLDVVHPSPSGLQPICRDCGARVGDVGHALKCNRTTRTGRHNAIRDALGSVARRCAHGGLDVVLEPPLRPAASDHGGLRANAPPTALRADILLASHAGLRVYVDVVVAHPAGKISVGAHKTAGVAGRAACDQKDWHYRKFFVLPQVAPLAIETGGRYAARGEEALCRMATLVADPMGDAHAGAVGAAAAKRRYREALTAMKQRVSVALWRGNGRAVASMLRALAERPVDDAAAALAIQQQAAVEAGEEALALVWGDDSGDEGGGGGGADDDVAEGAGGA